MSSESKTAAGPLTSSRDVLLQGVLDALSESPEAEVRDSTELARGAGYDHAALVGVIKSLAAEGYVAPPTVLKVKALRLVPEPRTQRHPGIVDIDGEVVPFGPIEMTSHPVGMRVMSL